MIDAACIIATQLLIGWLIADLLGGVLHWLEDRILSESTPLIGRSVVAPNRLHHREPLRFLEAGFIARNGTTWAAALAVSMLWLIAIGPSWVWAAATLGGLVSSMVHALAHRPPPIGHPLRILQEIGVIQSAAEHARHHRPPSTRRYCVLTDWLNPLLDGLRLWDALERLLGIAPARAAAP